MSDPRIDITLGADRTRFVSSVDGFAQTIAIGYENTTSTYLTSDPPRAEELSAALSVIELHLDEVARAWSAQPIPGDGRSVLTVAASVGSGVHGIGEAFAVMAAVEIGLAQYDPAAVDGFVLERSAAEDVFRTVATESLEDRLYNPGLPDEWGVHIVGGACIVVEMFRQWDLSALTVVSERR